MSCLPYSTRRTAELRKAIAYISIAHRLDKSLDSSQLKESISQGIKVSQNKARVMSSDIADLILYYKSSV